MLRDDCLDLLENRLGNRSDLRTSLLAELLLLQDTTLEGNAWIPWFLESTLQTLMTVAEDQEVALPADFLKEIDTQGLWRQDGTSWGELNKADFSASYAQTVNDGSGVPRWYALSGSTILLTPTPDAVYTLKWRYYQKDSVLSTNIENKWLANAADVVLAELGVVAASKYLQNPKLALEFRNDAKVAWERLYRKHISRQEDNGERVMDV